MTKHPYHHYLFFKVSGNFYQLSKDEQKLQKLEFQKMIADEKHLIISSYATLGLKAGTTFMLWCRGKKPSDVQMMLGKLLRTKLGGHLSISYTYFGIVRNSEYQRKTPSSKPSDQAMHDDETRLPYLVLYPFTKTTEWHALDFENRRSIMGQHIKVGHTHQGIRQCLLYSYGIDDQEFVVSYEMKTLEEFQDLVIEMRRTIGRKYTLADTPTYTCIYKTSAELMAWL